MRKNNSQKILSTEYSVMTAADVRVSVSSLVKVLK